jgi:hypothetical protein
LPLLREPLVVWVVLSLVCLFVVWVCFRLLESAAIIVKKEWQAGGAIAGFLLLLFGSWCAVSPRLDVAPVRSAIEPLSVPVGFTARTLSSAGVALAAPAGFLTSESPIQFGLTQKDPPAMALVAVQPYDAADDDGDYSLDEDELAELNETTRALMGFIEVVGPPQADPYRGMKSYVLPVKVEFSIPNTTPVNLGRYLIRQILDVERSRKVFMIYPDTEQGRQIFSTLNIGDPI